MFLFKRSASMPSPGDALKGRSEPILTPRRHYVKRRVAHSALARRDEDRRLRSSVASGAPTEVLADARLISTAAGYAGGYAQPDLRGGLFGPHGSRRGGACRLRPDARLLRGAAEGLLGGPRPDAGHAPGQRHRDAIPYRSSLSDPTRSAARRRRHATHTRPRWRRPGTGRSRRRSSIATRHRSSTPRTTTSNISPRTSTATARTTPPVCSCRTISW